MLHITMIGCGAIGVGVLELLEKDPQLCVDYVIASAGSEELVRQRLASFKQPPQVLTALPADARPLRATESTVTASWSSVPVTRPS